MVSLAVSSFLEVLDDGELRLVLILVLTAGGIPVLRIHGPWPVLQSATTKDAFGVTRRSYQYVDATMWSRPSTIRLMIYRRHAGL